MLDPIGALDQSCSVLGDNGTLLKTFWIIMKIDLYNNHNTFIAESKQDTVIKTWYCKYKLTAKDIDSHPCLPDLSILINIRDTYWDLMNPSERGTWVACWGNVFKLHYAIRPKTLRKLEQIVMDMAQREQRRHEQRQQIKSLRQANTEPLKRDHDNEAKGSHSHSLHRQTVINESAGECPYF